MRLVSFTLQDFRSITAAYKIRTGQTAILIGPNNEGKSNILRALVAAMNVLTVRGGPIGAIVAQRRPPFIRRRHSEWYDWERDYPVKLQQSKPLGKSVVTLEFRLKSEEVEQFRGEIGSNLNGTLAVRVIFSKDGNHSVEVAKQGRGGKKLTQKSRMIAQFLSSRLDFEYIPAIRTADSAQRLVDEMVQRQLAQLEDNPDYLAVC